MSRWTRTRSRGGTQGQRTLTCWSRNDFDQEGVAPAAAPTFHDQALAAGMLLQQRQREPVQPGEVLAQVPLAKPGLVLAERHVETPVTAILDTPVPPNSPGESLDVRRQAADVVADLDALLPVPTAARCRHPDRLQPFPLQQPRELLGGWELEIRSDLLAAMPRLSGHVLPRAGQVRLELFIDGIDDRLMQRLLVPFQGQDIVGPALDDLGRDRL